MVWQNKSERWSQIIYKETRMTTSISISYETIRRIYGKQKVGKKENKHKESWMYNKQELFQDIINILNCISLNF